MLFRKPPIWNLQPGLAARPWCEHWRGVKAVFPFWEPGGRSIYPVPRSTRWSLNNGAARRLTRYGPAVYFPGNSSNEVETADGNPILFDSGEPYTIALLILWTEDPGNEGIFRSGSANTGNWLWILSGASSGAGRRTSTARLRPKSPDSVAGLGLGVAAAGRERLCVATAPCPEAGRQVIREPLTSLLALRVLAGKTAERRGDAAAERAVRP